ncbi:uncharacterized protein BDZ99DRAFT_457728 [Mytilinidion resinicola]|uniref:Uncharacterized protein n=1 Tax=Mytilinidion resinicola TaxID=574789 RepID=A0A6A6Z535_9PEZI|nr:uncharacterized protein BDZ99DRAFT_457728 [Mytilinidion resinicola]KAF2815773.1 hypothetical protein BDZ99DRAFT_457728 [Mytilinidion resinicola]
MVFGYSPWTALSKVSNFVLGLLTPSPTTRMAVHTLLGKHLRDDEEYDGADAHGRIPQPTTAQRARLTPISRKGAAYSPTQPPRDSKSFSAVVAETIAAYEEALAAMRPCKIRRTTPSSAVSVNTAPSSHSTQSGRTRTGSTSSGAASSGSNNNDNNNNNNNKGSSGAKVGHPAFGLPSHLFPKTTTRSTFQPHTTSNITTHSHNAQSSSSGIVFGAPSIPCPDLTASNFSQTKDTHTSGGASSTKNDSFSSQASNPIFGSASLPRSRLPTSPVSTPSVATNDTIHSPPKQRERCSGRRHILECKHIVRTEKNQFCATNCRGTSRNTAFVCLECCIAHAAYLEYYLTEGTRRAEASAEKTDDATLWNFTVTNHISAILEAKYACRAELEKVFARGRHTLPAEETKIPRGGMFAPGDKTRDIYEKVALMPHEAILELKRSFSSSAQARKPEDTPKAANISNATTTTPSGGRFFTAQNGSSYYTGLSTRKTPNANPTEGASPTSSSAHRSAQARPPPRFRNIIPPPLVLGKRSCVETPESLQAPLAKHHMKKLAYVPDEADKTKRGVKHAREEGSWENPLAPPEHPAKRRSTSPPATFSGSLASRKRGHDDGQQEGQVEDSPAVGVKRLRHGRVIW